MAPHTILIVKILFTYALRLPLIVLLTYFFCLIFHETGLPNIQIRSNMVFIGRILLNGSIKWVTTNDLDYSVNLFVAEIKNDNRWQIIEKRKT